ncbi:MAG: ATP phosphoribosyltransferase [Pseudomonadota bacterium]
MTTIAPAGSRPVPELVFALPKGRILDEVMPIVRAAGIEPEPDFDNPKSRKLKFSTNQPGIHIIRVRAFDVATFVAFGAAAFGITGNDVLMEFDYEDIYAPVDLGIGRCRISVARPKRTSSADFDAARRSGHIRIATKYPHIARRHFASKGQQAECVKLNGAMELAPALGLSEHIVDLVSTGRTLKENGLEETEVIAEITSRLIVNRTISKTHPTDVSRWIDQFQRGVARAA